MSDPVHDLAALVADVRAVLEDERLRGVRGEPIGEDYTLAFAVRAVLGSLGAKAGSAAVVVNLSTSLVVEDAAAGYGAGFFRAPVGEAHVARMIQEEGAIVGGEGNGGVILPSVHIGRDAPIGVALILQLLLQSGQTVSGLVAGAPRYHIVKAKAPRGADLAPAYQALRKRFADATVDDRDGLRLSWPDRWVHLRPSGTEPIIRCIAEAPTAADAESLIEACRSLLS